jgi:hypothetical protein
VLWEKLEDQSPIPKNKDYILCTTTVAWLACKIKVHPPRSTQKPSWKSPPQLRSNLSGRLHPGADPVPGDRGDRCAEFDSVDVYREEGKLKWQVTVIFKMTVTSEKLDGVRNLKVRGKALLIRAGAILDAQRDP